MLIYKITNKINGKVYIGKTEKTIEHRWAVHLRRAQNHQNRYLYDAMNHYGYANFKIEEIEACESSEELCLREIFWIDLFKSQNKKYGYNMQRGGTGGAQPHELMVMIGKKAAEARKRNGYKVSEETKRKISESHRGKKLPTEVREKVSKSLTAKNALGLVDHSHNPMIGKCGSKHHFFGKLHTKEARLKIGLARAGKSYEQIFGNDKAKLLKERRRSLWVGAKNPNTKGYAINDIEKLLEMVGSGSQNKDICAYFNISYYYLLTFFKSTFKMTLDDYRKSKGINKPKRQPYVKIAGC